MQFTLVSTVFNEAKRINQTISDLVNQTLQPNEIIITDAGSKDGTYEILQKWAETSPVPIVVIQKLRCNVAEGRNIAINAAKYPVIASMDFGCRYDPNWLESIIRPFDDPSVNVVFGAFKVDESEQITLPAKTAYVITNGYHWDFHNVNMSPTSRSIAYKKEVFDKVGGYCEWLTLAADDTVFGKELRANGYDIYVADEPCSTWMRHLTGKAYMKESYRYGLGDGEARISFSRYKGFLNELLLKAGFYLSALFFLLSLILFHSSIIIVSLVCMIIFIYGFKSDYDYFKKWLRFRSSKYNFPVLIYGLYLTSYIKYGYIKGYIKGYYHPTPVQRKEAELLQKRLGNLNSI